MIFKQLRNQFKLEEN